MQRIQNKRPSSESQSSTGSARKKMATETRQSTSDGKQNDKFCWNCHRDGSLIHCELCPRSFHPKCGEVDKAAEEDWVCPECLIIMKAENMDTRSAAMKTLTVDQLSSLLKFSLTRMKQICPEEFQKPVPLDDFPNYPDVVIHPMDLETLESNLKRRVYGCTEAFLADVKWIHHNCVLFNGYQHKLSGIAKNLVKICKHEMGEIEVCPDCYYNAYTKRENWFQEPCCPPHLLIWAKLKGFPFWPAKAMSIVSGNVDVRFFGAHDRAWIPVSQCFLLSVYPPAWGKLKVKRKGVFEQSMDELSGHIAKLKENFNAFQYAPDKSSIQSDDLLTHVASMLPGVNIKEFRRSFMMDKLIQPRFFSAGANIKYEEDKLTYEKSGSESDNNSGRLSMTRREASDDDEEAKSEEKVKVKDEENLRNDSEEEESTERSKVDVNLENTVDSLLDDTNAETLHIQLNEDDEEVTEKRNESSSFMYSSDSGNEGNLIIDLGRDTNKKSPNVSKSTHSHKKKNTVPKSRFENDSMHSVSESKVYTNPRIYTMVPKLFPKSSSARDAVRMREEPETLEETFEELNGKSPSEIIQYLKLEMEKMRWFHNQEIMELKHNNDLVLLEMRNSLDYAQQRAIADVVSQCELEKQKAIEESKRKQWCCFCGKEAIYYCCWNTSYCDFSCQQAHWPQHNLSCQQKPS